MQRCSVTCLENDAIRPIPARQAKDNGPLQVIASIRFTDSRKPAEDRLFEIRKMLAGDMGNDVQVLSSAVRVDLA